MPDLTPRLGLKKPLGNENVTRAAYNENLDIVDTNAAKKTDLDSHVADSIKHITAAERSAWNAKLSNTINQDIQMTGDFEITGMVTERSAYANIHHNLASFKGLTSPETGCIVLETAIPFGTSVMGMVEIDIYEYNTTTTVSKLVVGFYSGNAGAVQVSQQGHVLIGNRRLRVRLANKSGKVAIIIGETTDSFSYPQVVVSKATLTYSNLSNMTYREGWLITNKVIDLTPYVNQVESTDRTGLALKADFDAHIGSGGASHAVATTTAAGFMSVADYTKLQGIQAGAEVNQSASGFWSDTTTQVAPNTTYTKTIPVGFTGKKGRLVVRHGSTNTWATVYFSTDSTKATSVEVTSTPASRFYSKALGDARLGSSNTYISEGVNASATGLTDVYISGSNLIIVFRNGASASTATLSVGACYWEVEG